jgi:hypothetical protein
MANAYGIPKDVEQRIRARDLCCAYCHKPYSLHPKTDQATIEHLNERPPFRWKDGLTEDGLVIACWSCNCSRGNKTLTDWFQASYCIGRGINEATVAEPVRRYLQRGVQTINRLESAAPGGKTRNPAETQGDW